MQKQVCIFSPILSKLYFYCALDARNLLYVMEKLLTSEIKVSYTLNDATDSGVFTKFRSVCSSCAREIGTKK